MIITFQGGRVQQRNRLIYRYACDANTRISVVVGGNITVYPYQVDAGSLLISVAGGGNKALPPPALTGPAINFAPLYTEVSFQGLQLVQLPSPGHVFMVTVDGPAQVTGGGGWLPGFDANVANASQINWYKDQPIGDPHDPGR